MKQNWLCVWEGGRVSVSANIKHQKSFGLNGILVKYVLSSLNKRTSIITRVNKLFSYLKYHHQTQTHNRENTHTHTEKNQLQLTSMIFLLVRLSCGSLYSVYFNSTLSISVLAYWYNLLLLENIINAISQSHSTDNSYAFFITPNLRLLKVTWKSIKYERKRRKKKTKLNRNRNRNKMKQSEADDLQ